MKPNGNVYFARCGQLVKIGFTEDLGARLASLQTGNPRAITIVAVITDALPSVERHCHREFAAHRVRGEWFSYSAVLALIRHIQAGAQPKTPSALAFYREFKPPQKEKIAPMAGMGPACGEVRRAIREGGWAEKRATFLARGEPYVAAVTAVEKRFLQTKDRLM